MNDIKIVEMDDFRKKHIAVLCLPGLEGFLGDIVEHLRKEYIVTTCYSKDMAELERAIKDADLCFFEWCNELFVEASQKLPILAEKKVIVRLHSYEALSGFVPHARWSVCDVLIFVAKHIQDLVVQQLPGLLNKDLNPPEMVIIPNGVAC